MVFLRCMDKICKVFLPIAEHTGKVRLKKLVSDSPCLGEPAGSVGGLKYGDLKNGKYYLEWQIGYDLGVDNLVALVVELETLKKNKGKKEREKSLKKEIKEEVKEHDVFSALKNLKKSLDAIKNVKREETRQNHYKTFRKNLNKIRDNEDLKKFRKELDYSGKIDDFLNKLDALSGKIKDLLERWNMAKETFESFKKVLNGDFETYLMLVKLSDRLAKVLCSNDTQKVIPEWQRDFVALSLFCGDESKEILFYRDAEDKIKVLYELPVMFYYFLKEGLYNLDVLSEIENFGSLVKENELFLESSKQIKREIVQEKLHSSVKFKEFAEKIPGYIIEKKKDNSLEYFVELKIGHLQRGVGYQSMVYLCLPLTKCSFSLSGDNEILKKEVDSKSYCCFEISSENKEVLIDTLKAFVLASEKHKEDVLRFLKVIRKKLHSDSC